MDELKYKTNSELSGFLFDFYQEKDELMDHFKKEKKFPGKNLIFFINNDKNSNISRENEAN